MARSKQSFQKTEKEKLKKRKQKDKEEKAALRKANSNKGKGFDSMIAYVDHNGHLSDTPPDPKLNVEVKAENISLGNQTFSQQPKSNDLTGRITLYNSEKAYGFIKDSDSMEKFFFHISNTEGNVKQGDTVTFKLAKGPKGFSAVEIVVTG